MGGETLERLVGPMELGGAPIGCDVTATKHLSRWAETLGRRVEAVQRFGTNLWNFPMVRQKRWGDGRKDAGVFRPSVAERTTALLCNHVRSRDRDGRRCRRPVRDEEPRRRPRPAGEKARRGRSPAADREDWAGETEDGDPRGHAGHGKTGPDTRGTASSRTRGCGGAAPPRTPYGPRTPHPATDPPSGSSPPVPRSPRSPIAIACRRGQEGRPPAGARPVPENDPGAVSDLSETAPRPTTPMSRDDRN